MGRRTRSGTAVVATWIAMGSAAAAPPPSLPADPAVLARAQALKTMPCAGGPLPGFAGQDGVPAAWHVGGATVSVRRAGGDRFAFVLGPPSSGATDCPVRDVLVLPRTGMLLRCALPDGSSAGLGVHGKRADGRRDVLFWRGDGAGGLHRLDLDAAGLETDTGALICALPDEAP